MVNVPAFETGQSYFDLRHFSVARYIALGIDEWVDESYAHRLHAMRAKLLNLVTIFAAAAMEKSPWMVMTSALQRPPVH